MNNLLEEFIPYELALELKNIGFEEHCFGYYSYSHYYDKYFPIVYIKNYLYLSSKPEIPKDSRLAPTYSQCFKWFRKKHNLESRITGAKLLIDNLNKDITFLKSQIDGK